MKTKITRYNLDFGRHIVLWALSQSDVFPPRSPKGRPSFGSQPMRKLVLLLLMALSAFPASMLLAANDVGSVYAVLKEQRYNQTDNSGAALTSSQPYRFDVYVSQAAGGTLTGGTVTPPGTGSIHTPQSLTPNNDGTGSWNVQDQKFDSFSALNAAFGDGPYAVHITGANGTYNAQLTLSGEVYPAEVPQVLNTNFNGGVLIIDPTQPFTVTWNSFADHGVNDAVVFETSNSSGTKLIEQILAPNATSQLIPANLLDPNDTYQIQIIFIKASDSNTASIAGSTGVAGYAFSTKINVSPTPVPNLFASINGTAQNGGGSIFQYTPAGDESTLFDTIDRPRGLAFDSAGNLFVATNTLDNLGNFQATIVKISHDGSSSDFATGFTANFFIGAIATDRTGNVFALAQDDNDPNFASTIVKITPGGTGSTFASIPGQGLGLAFDSEGNLYVSDHVDQTIYKFTPSGTQSVFAGPGSFSGVVRPEGLAFDKFGNLFASTFSNAGNGSDTILKFTPNGTASTFATGLSAPRGLAFDSAGNLFVTESVLGAPSDILEFDPAGTGTVFASNLPTANGRPEYLASNEFPVIIGGNQSASATVGQPFVYQITATNHPGFYGASGLPPGLSIDATEGLIFGLPTVSGNFPVTLSAWNPCGTGLANLAITVQPAPSGPQIISSTSSTGRTGQPFQFQILTSGATSSARFSTTPLPSGLSADPITGLISGTPTGDGNFSITLTVTDGLATASAVLQLTFTSDPDVPVITSSAAALLAPGLFFSRRLTADATASFSYIGSDGVKHEGPSSAGLPPGLSFDGVDLISGTYNPPTGGAGATSFAAGPNSARLTVANHTIHPYTITIRPRLIGNCQPIATNDNGTTSAPLNFFEGSSNLVASQPPDIIVEATGPSGSTVSFTPPTVTDGNGGNLPVTSNPASGSVFPVGPTTVACTSTADSFGAYAIVTFSVTVQDTTPPVITAMPVSITVGAPKARKGQPQGTTVDFASQLSATDTVDGTFTPTATPVSGSLFPLGSTVVSVTAKDKHGNMSAPRTFMLTVSSKVKKAKAASMSVSVSPATISEGGSATYTISATAANPSLPTVVNYAMSGMGTPADQFYTLSGTPNHVTIPSGGSSATVTLTAKNNSLSTGNETAIMTIGPGSGYKVGKKTLGATVTINNGP
jgi:sugar lactone lactonase YvrE